MSIFQSKELFAALLVVVATLFMWLYQRLHWQEALMRGVGFAVFSVSAFAFVEGDLILSFFLWLASSLITVGARYMRDYLDGTGVFASRQPPPPPSAQYPPDPRYPPSLLVFVGGNVALLKLINRGGQLDENTLSAINGATILGFRTGITPGGVPYATVTFCSAAPEKVTRQAGLSGFWQLDTTPSPEEMVSSYPPEPSPSAEGHGDYGKNYLATLGRTG